jgi:chromosome partition protein MukF
VSQSHQQDPRSILTTLAESKPALELGTLDLCFLAALQLRAGRAVLSAFGEDQLVDVFEQVCHAVDAEAINVRLKAAHAIQRLREQKLLARVDGAGVIKAGEFALTRLAAAIVECFLEDESLTRENLAVLMRALRSSLEESAGAARRAKGDEWRSQVEAPLRITVADLVSGIERRQRGLDAKQADFQQHVAALLQSDWFGAVERCQGLLESSSRTLAELNDMLLRDTAELGALLTEIQELAALAGQEAAEVAALRVVEQVDRIAAWGCARQRAWSEYYQYVHRYLCDVVRLDPSRALTQRLREQLSAHAARPFALRVAAEPSIRLLRDVEAMPEDRPPVRRPKRERERAPSPADTFDPHAAIEARVREVLADGATGLQQVTERVTETLPSEERFIAAGRVAQVVARLRKPASERERPWLPVAEGLLIEEWAVGEVRGRRD